MLYSFLMILFPCKDPGSSFNAQMLLFLLLFCCYGNAMLASETPVVVFFVPGVKSYLTFKGLFTGSGGPRSSGVGFFCFHALGDTKQKKPTPVNRGPPLHVNRV